MVSYSNSSSSEETNHHPRHHHNHQWQQQNNPSEYYLHSVQRPSSAPKAYKRPPNSLASKPRVYKVKPIHFRELVQQLTGASSTLLSQSHPPLSVPPCLRLQNQSHASIGEQPFAVETEEQKPALNKNGGSQGTAELALSPNFQPWFSLALLSPGSVL